MASLFSQVPIFDTEKNISLWPLILGKCLLVGFFPLSFSISALLISSSHLNDCNIPLFSWLYLLFHVSLVVNSILLSRALFSLPVSQKPSLAHFLLLSWAPTPQPVSILSIIWAWGTSSLILYNVLSSTQKATDHLAEYVQYFPFQRLCSGSFSHRQHLPSTPFKVCP